jgi:hypothetical protein
MAPADPQPGTELQQTAALRPTTYHEASSAYRYTGDAQKRHDELTQRAALAHARAALRARGELDPARHGTEDYEPLNVDEHLEVLATGEVVARAYRHPANVDRALKAGATWEQVAAALDCDEAHARQDYRKWAEGQHRLWAGEYGGGGEFGMNDAEYAEALARADAAADVPGAAKAYAESRRVLCAHADQDGHGAHWPEPGEKCSASEAAHEAKAG